MKKLLYIFIITFLIFASSGSALALSPTPTPTPDQTLNQKIDSQINQLKDKIASRVSELNLVEKRGIIGTVSDTTNTQITVNDINGNSRGIDVDEITKFSSPSSKSFGLSDLTKGTKVSVLGLYNKQTKRILARFVSVSVDPTFLTGEISDIDSKNITLNIISDNQKKTKIDIESPTKISIYDKDLGLSKTTFLKLAAGDRISVIGFPDKKDQTMIVADRIIDYPTLPKDPQISITQSITPTETQTPTPTTSTRKLLPTRTP